MTESRLAVEILFNHEKIWTTTKSDLNMSICQKGLDAKVKSQLISIKVPSKDSYIQLANAIDWIFLAKIALPDIENTAKGFYWLGRKINLRIHLSILILQPLLKETDRGIIELIKHCPRLQAFCGYGIISKWKLPHHTKIEEFRNRLLPETYKNIGHHIVKLAQEMGFANPSWMDVDSTVQEANVAYPADANLMRKLAQKCKKARNYFFLSKNTAIEKKREIFASYHHLVKEQLKDFINFTESMTQKQIKALPWNIRADIKQIREKSWRYLLDVAHFIRTNSIKAGKILSWHCQEVACISKKKAGKEIEFGRQVQLGRIGGNFIISFSSTEVRMEDKKSVDLVIEEHAEIFGPEVLKSIGADKGYHSGKNIAYAESKGINADGMQRPHNVKKFVKEDVALPLRDRRAGIEPLIGHAKQFGLGKSRMKSDRATVASVHRSVMGFNLHQLKRKIGRKEEKLVA